MWVCDPIKEGEECERFGRKKFFSFLFLGRNVYRKGMYRERLERRENDFFFLYIKIMVKEAKVLPKILGSNFASLGLGMPRESIARGLFLEFSLHLGKKTRFRESVANALTYSMRPKWHL